MKQIRQFLMMFVALTVAISAFGQKAKTLTPEPLANKVSSTLKPIKSSADDVVAMIAWGGDISTIHGVEEGIFAKNGWDNIKLEAVDDFKKQVQQVINGERVLLRGTMAMINQATEAIKKAGGDVVVLGQLTWSEGGDAMVVRPGKNLNNIKKVALQLYGPHMDYAAKLFRDKGRLNQVEFVYFEQLTISNKVNGMIVDPITAFQEDGSFDAVMCISPDAFLLTSNNTVGTGGDGSVKGAKILASTVTTNRVIADVYAMRKDYYDNNKTKAEGFYKAMLQSQESLQNLMKTGQSSSKFMQLMIKSADHFGLTDEDCKIMLTECSFVGHNGNKNFFTGSNTNRNFATLNKEIQTAFNAMGVMTTKPTIATASWNYAANTAGVKTVTSSKPKFNKEKAQILAEATSFSSDLPLFEIEIYFEPNQKTFSASQYAKDFAKALDIAETNSGALVVVEGHSDPLAILQAEYDLKKGRPGKSKAEINQMRQKAKSLSVERAEKVREAFLQYAASKGVKLDPSQFYPTGVGAKHPKYNPPTNEKEWNENRRVLFIIRAVEGEADVFTPLN